MCTVDALIGTTGWDSEFKMIGRMGADGCRSAEEDTGDAALLDVVVGVYMVDKVAEGVPLLNVLMG